MPDILLIDDDERMSEPLAEYFQRFGLALTSTPHPLDGLARLRAESFDLVILDVMLPEMDGFEVCRRIREWSEIPIIMLTARGELTDRVVGLELGADDYLPKPFEPRELVARIQANLKRVGRQSAPARTLRFAELEIQLDRHEVTVAGRVVELTHMEYQLLTLLARSPGNNFSRDQILNHLKGIDAELFTRSVDNLVSRLRAKLRPADPIKTVWGAGYTFVARSP